LGRFTTPKGDSGIFVIKGNVATRGTDGTMRSRDKEQESKGEKEEDRRLKVQKKG